ncbi:unnamed protein product [Amoebophrya sp. A25]|nr:unnamed protein product [Amoebophrya sp. A25]|eukprot:GSA25T00026114001.1
MLRQTSKSSVTAFLLAGAAVVSYLPPQVLALNVGQTKVRSSSGSFFGGSADEGSLLKPMGTGKHMLRVCNALPQSESIEVFRGEVEKLTEKPLQYRGCVDLHTELEAGDQLHVRNAGTTSAADSLGSFSLNEVPESPDAVLFLAVYRHDAVSRAVSFASHVFASLQNAQIAVLDTYKGAKKSQLLISGNYGRSEELRFDSVVAVNPGRYRTQLVDSSTGREETSALLDAQDRQAYVVLRVGVDNIEDGGRNKDSTSFGENLLVFPSEEDEGVSLPRRMIRRAGDWVNMVLR